MKRYAPRIVKYVLALITIVSIALLTQQFAQGSGENTNSLSVTELAASFDYVEIDSSIGGDVKLVGDIDGDSYPDLIMGGIQSERLNWYRYPNWEKTVIHTPDVEFTTDGAIGDVDGDGDLDIVVPDGNSGNNLRWFENPRPSGDPAVGSQWIEHTIGSIGSWGKDVHLADYDGNGRLDVATRQQSQAMIFFQTGVNVWTKMTFSGLNLGNEGMTSGRVDNDANHDLVLRGTWVKNPGGTAARTASNWIQYTIGTANSDFKALVVDLNQNGVTDVLFSSSENTDEVAWWEPTSGDPTGFWTKHTIVASLERAHTLQVADMDLDGDNDVVLAQMHTSAAKELMIMDNLNGQATSWQKQVIDNTGLHNGVVADIGNDGDFDIFGANWTGNPPVKLYLNQLDPVGSLDDWTYKQVASNHEQTFGLTFGDVNGDGPIDIISGHYWYRNPGGDMLGGWVQTALPSGMHALLVQDVDGDARIDVIAQQHQVTTLGVYWLEATNAAGTAWSSVQIGTVPVASHNLGAQGYRAGQIEAGGRPEILISSGQGIYYFRIPASPGSGNWPRVQLSGNPSDEGFALGDIDRDSLLDVAATTGDSKRVEWYKNPGNGAANWAAFHIGDFQEALFPDRTEVADINGDNRLDIIVTEENGGDSGAETYWWEAPTTPTNGNWSRHLVVSQATTNSMDTADMDGDGDTDIALGEHRGSERVTIWENDGVGNLTEHVVGSGHENHLGARTIDLDNDGDLDIVSIAYDDWQFVHLWRNDSTGGPTPTSTPPPTNTSTPSSTPPGPTNTPTTTPTATATLPCSPGAGRVTNDQQVLYLFTNGSGSVVSDVAGVGTPIDLTIGNVSAVSWLPNGGLVVNSPTIIQSGSPPTRLFNALTGSNQITMEAWVIPANVSQNGPARILTLSADAFSRNFTMGQEFNAYEMRLRTTSTDNNGFPPMSAPGGSATTNLTHIVYTRQQNGQSNIYVNNSQIASENRGGNFSSWNNQYPLALANELNGDRAWLGAYHLVAIYNRALTTAEIAQNFQAGPRPNGNCDPTPTATNTPVPTATNTPVPTSTATNTPLPTPTATATNTPVPTATATNPPVPTATATNTPIPTATSTRTPLPTATATNTPIPTATATNTAVPTATATNTPVPTATATNTPVPSATATTVASPTVTPPCSPTPTGTSRVTDGQQVLYLFTDRRGNIVTDSAEVGTPIDLTIANMSAVSWVRGGGLSINSPTIVQSNLPPTRLLDALTQSNEITMEAWVIPANVSQNGPARILTLSQDGFLRNFTLGQEFNAYDMRLRTTNTDNNGLPSVSSPAGSATQNLTHIIYTRQQNGQVRVYVDNALVTSATRSGNFSNWNNQYRLAIANELTLERPWLGTFYLTAVYSRALTPAEVAQNYQAGPQPDKPAGPGGCRGFVANADASPVVNANADGATSAVSWFMGLLGSLVMGGLGLLGFQNVRVRTEK